MKKIFTIFILTLFSINVSYSKDNPYKFLKKEILIGKAKKELVNDTRSISKKKALSIVEDENGKAIKITLDTKFKGHKDDWERTGERNQRWEMANAKKPRKFKKPVYVKYKFKLNEFPIKNNLGGSLFQVIANKGNERLLPWMKFQYSDNRLAHQINFTKEVFYLQGDLDNTNFDKIGYKFYLGHVKDYKDYRTLSLKILASKKENGEIIGWLDDKRIFEVYGPNFTIGNGYTFKWGFYRWLEQMSLKTIPTQSVTVKEFGFSDKCEEILDQDKCSYSSNDKESVSYVRFKKSSRRDKTHGKKISKSIKWDKPLPEIKPKDSKLEKTTSGKVCKGIPFQYMKDDGTFGTKYKPIEKYLQDNELDFEPGTKAYKDFMEQFGC